MSFMSVDPNDSEAINAINETEDSVHNSIVLLYGTLVAVFACICNDLSIIFGFFAAFAETFNDFWAPSILFFCALNYKK